MTYTSKILVVDDDPLGLKTIIDILVLDGYDVVGAESGLEALSLVDQFDPDLILLDVMMPDMDGFEVCEKLRANPQTAALPIIMVTALQDSQARLHGIEVGADDFLSKPFDSIELRARVRTITRLNRYRKLVTERAKFEIVANHSPDGYLLVNDQGRCLYANPQARLYFDVTDDAPIGDYFFRPLAAEIYHFEPVNTWLTWPEPTDGVRYLVRPMTRQFKPLWLQVDTLDQVVDEGEEAWVISLRDVTAEVLTRHELWQFHQAIHHKLRTPFVGLFGGLDLLAKQAAALPVEQVQKLATTSYNSARRLWQHIENIIAYIDATDAGRVGEDDCRLADFPAIVSEVEAQLALKKVSLLLSEPVAAMMVPLSARLLELLLWELLENAQKFHPEQDPAITIEGQVVDETAVVLRISDDGQHLASEELGQVWQPYYQAERLFTGEVAGTGLGLAMVASIIWNIGGECRMLNRPDRPGVIVELKLPACDDDSD